MTESRDATARASQQRQPIEEIDGEVLRTVAASRVSRSDAFTLFGDDPDGDFSCVGSGCPDAASPPEAVILF